MEILEKIKKFILEFFNGNPESDQYIKDALEGLETIPEMPVPSKYYCVDKNESWFFTDEAASIYDEAEGYEQKSIMLGCYLHKIADSKHDNEFLIRIAFLLVNICERLQVKYSELLGSSSKFRFAVDEYLKSDIEDDYDACAAKRVLCSRFIYALRNGALEKPDKDFIEHKMTYLYDETRLIDPRLFAYDGEDKDIEYLLMLTVLLAEASEKRSFEELEEQYKAGLGG